MRKHVEETRKEKTQPAQISDRQFQATHATHRLRPRNLAGLTDPFETVSKPQRKK